MILIEGDDCISNKNADDDEDPEENADEYKALVSSSLPMLSS